MTPFRLIEISLGTWYLAYIISMPQIHGPFGVLDWIRTHITLGGLTSCMFCLAPWIFAGLALVPDGVIIWACAGAGLAMLAHGYSGWRYNNG